MNSTTVRLIRELKETRKTQFKPSLCFEGEFRQINKWQVQIGIPTGENEVKYASLEIRFGEQYPREAPKCYFGKGFYHPNVFPSGQVCHSILGEGWSPKVKLQSVVEAIQKLMLDPNLSSPAQEEAAQDLIDNIELYWHKFCNQSLLS